MSDEWYPDISGRQGPRYAAIADAIGEALASGRLDSGMQLPTQRDLARRLNVTIGTVSRAYQEAERRGFVSGEVGRGTYIRENARHSARSAPGARTTREPAPGPNERSAHAGPTDKSAPATGAPAPAGGTKTGQTARNGSVVHLFKRGEADPADRSAPPDEKPSGPPGGSRPETAPAAPTGTADPAPAAPERGDRPPRPAARDETDGEADVIAARPINLASNRLPEAGDGPFRARLRDVLGAMDVARLATHAVAPTDTDACRAASRILARLGVAAGPGEILLAPSAATALDAVLAVSTKAGDGVLVEALLDPTIRTVLQRHRLRLHPVQLDGEGVVPESFELACWSSGARLFLTMPTAHNPTATTASTERRQAIAEISERYGVNLIEWSGALPAPTGAPDSLAALAPHRTALVADLGACALAGLRLGVVTAPSALLERIGRETAELNRLLPGLSAGMLRALAEPGAYETIVEAQRNLLAQRRAVFVRALGEEAAPRLRATATHGWLRLPEMWRAGDFSVAAAVRGVLVAGAEHFQAGRGQAPRAVRVAWGGLSGVEEAANAGAILGQLLARAADDDLVSA